MRLHQFVSGVGKTLSRIQPIGHRSSEAQPHDDGPGQFAPTFMGNVDHEAVFWAESPGCCQTSAAMGMSRLLLVPGQHAAQGNDETT